MHHRAYKPNLATQINLFTDTSHGHASGLSAPRRGILSSPPDHLSQEDGYLVKWLSSRLEPTTLTLREDSALTTLASDRRQIARLLCRARALGLDLFVAVNKKQVA